VSSRVAEVQVLLEGVALPATKDELLHHARHERADGASLALLEALPEREYGSIDEVRRDTAARAADVASDAAGRAQARERPSAGR